MVRVEEQERDCRPDQRARRVQRLVKAESLSKIILLNRACEHRGPDRLTEAATHPSQPARHYHLRPAGHREQQGKAETGRAITADR